MKTVTIDFDEFERYQEMGKTIERLMEEKNKAWEVGDKVIFRQYFNPWFLANEQSKIDAIEYIGKDEAIKKLVDMIGGEKAENESAERYIKRLESYCEDLKNRNLWDRIFNNIPLAGEEFNLIN